MPLCTSVAALWLLGVGAQAAEPDRDLLCFDFETGDLQGWRVVEGKFDKFLCRRAVYHHHGGTYNKQGTTFLSTLERADDRPDDRFIGVAESPVNRRLMHP